MSSFPARFYLRRDERVLLQNAITPAWALEQALVWLIVGLFLFGAPALLVLLLESVRQEEALLYSLGVAFLLFWVLMLIVAWRRIVTSEFVVTDEAVYTRRGRLLLAVDVATLDRVTDMHVHMGIIGRIFSYARLVIKTAGGELIMVGLRDAYTIRGHIHEARQRLLTRLLREAGRQEERADATQSLQIQCPNCLHAFDVKGAAPIDVRCPHCQATGTLFEEALA